MNRLFCLALYVGIGAFLHALILGASIDWHSAWSIAWLFAWPIMLIVSFWIAVACIAAAIAFVWFIVLFWQNFQARRRLRIIRESVRMRT